MNGTRELCLQVPLFPGQITSCKHCNISARVESSRDEIPLVNVPLQSDATCFRDFVKLTVRHAYAYAVHSTLPCPAFRNPVTSLYLSGDVAMVNMALTHTEKHMLGHVRVGACTCTIHMCVYMHVHVCASLCILSYGRIRVTYTLRDGGAQIGEG